MIKIGRVGTNQTIEIKHKDAFGNIKEHRIIEIKNGIKTEKEVEQI